MRITVWIEFIHETGNPAVADVCPGGSHGALAEAFSEGTEGAW